MHQAYKCTSKCLTEPNEINCKWDYLREFGFTIRIVKFEFKLRDLGENVCFFNLLLFFFFFLQQQQKLSLVMKNSLWHSCLKRNHHFSPFQTWVPEVGQHSGVQVTVLGHIALTFHLSTSKCSVAPSLIQPFVTPRTIACQAPLSMEFSRQEYWV